MLRYIAVLKAWIEIQELPKHIAVVFRVALGGVLAWYATGEFSQPVFFLTLLAVFFIADGAFISNEYFDYQTDSINLGRLGGQKQGITSTGGTRVLCRRTYPAPPRLDSFFGLFLAGGANRFNLAVLF
jgi:1,4-dihydroxy-2-naphthoate octaprenyltransferase